MVAKLSEFKAKCTENRKLGIERKENINIIYNINVYQAWNFTLKIKKFEVKRNQNIHR